MAGESINDYETVRQRKDGRLVPVSIAAAPVRDGSGRVVGNLVAYTDITERKEQAAEVQRLNVELRARLEELAASRTRIVTAGDVERRRLERNLHDGAQQRIVALSLSLRVALAKLDADPAAAGALLADAGEELSLALDELRELARGLHPAVLSDRGLRAAVEALASRAPVAVELAEMPDERLPAPVEAAAYYLIAEALTNVAKYAAATAVRVRVVAGAGSVTVEVTDDGVGGADPAGGSGLRGLADRVEALGGSLEVHSPGRRHLAAWNPSPAMTISREFHLGLFATAGVPQIVEGDGIELVAADGRRYLDACSGAISVNSLGYGNEAVVEAMAAQLRRLSYTMPFRFTNDRALELAAAMNEVSGGAIDRAMFYTGGSEAVEAALKLARNYHYLEGRTEKELTVARVHSYHGNTFAALSAGGVRQRREPYSPLLWEGPRVAMPLDGNPLDPVAETGPNVYGRGVAEDLRELVEAVGPERVSAFIMEPVGGAGAPGHAPAPGYFEGVREICDEYDIVLIADEVITGLGRTGRMFGSDHWRSTPICGCARRALPPATGRSRWSE